jgi:hypothetical protein
VSKNTTTATEASVLTPQEVKITPLKIKHVTFQIEGQSPYLQNKWTDSAIKALRSGMEEGSRSKDKKKKTKPARKFDGEWRASMHVSTEGWPGIPVAAFRGALISACKLVGFAMTDAKLVIDIAPDGYDYRGSGLIRIHGEPEGSEMLVVNATGVPDIRCRPIWKQWGATLQVSFDSDTFSVQDISNLIYRAGLQVGVGAGRPASKRSNGLGYGKFITVGEAA